MATFWPAKIEQFKVDASIFKNSSAIILNNEGTYSQASSLTDTLFPALRLLEKFYLHYFKSRNNFSSVALLLRKH